MPAMKLRLSDLLAPQFLLGFNFPTDEHGFLSELEVDRVGMTYDEMGVVYTGRVSFSGVHKVVRIEDSQPKGAAIEWNGVEMDFRLTIPRDGAGFIDKAVDQTVPVLNEKVLGELDELFATFGEVEQTWTLAGQAVKTTPTEYPGVRFRLELLVNALDFYLSRDHWLPGEVGADYQIKPSADANAEVKFVLPKVVLQYEQGDDLSKPPSFRLNSWGSAGFDAPHDLAEGELIRMEPSIALHVSQRYAFGVDEVLLDLSEDNTPPEIIKFFGVDAAFQGLYLKSVRFYYFDDSKKFGINVAVNDALISFAGEVSLEAEADILMAKPLRKFDVDVRFYDGKRRIRYTEGHSTHRENEAEAIIETTINNSSAIVPQTALVQVDVQGGFPDYSITMRLKNGLGEVWKAINTEARISPKAPVTPGETIPAELLTKAGEYTLVVIVEDFADIAGKPPTPYKRHQFTQIIKLWVTPAEENLKPEQQDGSHLDRPKPGTQTPPPLVVKPKPRQPSLPQRYPPVLRRLSFRARLERNVPVLMEFSGEIDFETRLEMLARQGWINADSKVDATAGDLHLEQQPGASEDKGNPQDGVIDFKLNVTYDTATRQLTETLTLGAHPDDINGLLQMKNEFDPLKNILGALLVFTPIINEAASALDPQKAGDWAVLGGSLAVPVAIGVLPPGNPVFQTQRATLYGGEMKFRQYLPKDGDPLLFTDAGIIFDYGVEFGIKIEALKIETTRPLKVRYRAVGFNLHFQQDGSGPPYYQPIFDTSQGYELDLGDPGLFKLPSEKLGNLLKVTAARIARFNPLTLELDLSLKADLGVVTVDEFKVKMPLYPKIGPPMIEPTGVRVNVPGVLAGEGRVDIKPGGVAISGSLDLTLVAAKFRLAASLAVETIENPAKTRKAVAVFAGLNCEFPAPLPFFATGLGMYALSGLFAMHYKRDEAARQPGDPISPALHWLAEKANGDPTKQEAWVTEFDRWSFGLGLSLGSMDGGFLVNFSGMFILELPGPRFLIPFKLLVINKLPKLKDAKVTTGVLGVIDLDFNQGQLTVGLVIDIGAEEKLQELVQIRIPVEIFFKFHERRNWHLWVGTVSYPATVTILKNTVRARGYFMIDGKGIANFPPAPLPGIALALGLEASLIFGKESIGLYLRVAAGAHLGVAFPKNGIFIAGEIFLEGELRLFVVSIEASARLSVTAPEPATIIRGEVCGKVKLFFFTVGGCVSIAIGDGDPKQPEPPPLVLGVYLQSHAPVISAGQGGDRPIDASLGNALEVGGSGEMPKPVPIDSIPVIQFFASPLTDDVNTFTEPLTTAPGLTPDGWISLGGEVRANYRLKKISLWANGVEQTFSLKPPATWRREPPPGPPGANTNVDLALFSRTPAPTPRALERSTDLNELVNDRWQDLCKDVAPAVCVLWTFCRQTIGTSGEGWKLDGIAQPDPPNTWRHAPPPTRLLVEEPAVKSIDGLMNLLLANVAAEPATNASLPFDIPAEIVGRDRTTQREGEPDPSIECVDFRRQEWVSRPLPLTLGKATFTIPSAQQAKIVAISGFTGLSCGATLQINLPEPATFLEFTLVTFGAPAEVEVTDTERAGPLKLPTSVVKKFKMTGERGKAEKLTITGKQLNNIIVRASQGETLLLSFCFRLPSAEKDRPKTDCLRALQLPRRQPRTHLEPLRPTPGTQAYNKTRPDNQWIILNTGVAESVTLFAAVAKPLRAGVKLIELDENNNELKQTQLALLAPQPITGITDGLPPKWLDPALPWRAEVLSVAALLAERQFGDLERLVFTLKPQPQCVKLKIVAPSPKPLATSLGVLIGAVQVCSLAEINRAKQGQEIKNGEIKTVVNYLNGGDSVPLLKPGTEYTLKIDYEATSKAITQQFRFTTDSKPPERLAPYVLGVTPDNEDQYHFYTDPVRVVFNDTTVLPLFAAYGKKLRASLHAADGIPIPTEEVLNLDPINAEVSTPYREALAALTASGRIPCVGSIKTPVHGCYTLHAKEEQSLLRPLMAYTLDIEAADIKPGPSQTPSVITPLFRRAFATSRFANLSELVKELTVKGARHRALRSRVQSLPAGAPVVVVTDKEIQDALLAAGEQALPAAGSGPVYSPAWAKAMKLKPVRAVGETGITIYWTRRPGAATYSPHIIMIDAAEPLWRTRQEPRIEIVPNQSDINFKRVVPQSVPAMEVFEKGGSQITRFVRSAGGTRTLAFVSDSFAGGTITLAARRLPSTLYSLKGEEVTIAALTLMPTAPWDNDTV